MEVMETPQYRAGNIIVHLSVGGAGSNVGGARTCPGVFRLKLSPGSSSSHGIAWSSQNEDIDSSYHLVLVVVVLVVVAVGVV